MCDSNHISTILGWYDTHARVMPWRVPPAARAKGVRPDPYRVWLSEIMLQQTTVAAVRSYFLDFTERWPDIRALAAAEDAQVMAQWAGLGYYARARNLLKCARQIVADYNGVFPQTEAELRQLPGIGPYTAAAIAAIAFDQPANVVDGNVERVMARLHDVHDPLPQSKPQLKDLAAQYVPTIRPGDYAQALMDLGATICTPRNPACGDCPLSGPCAAHAAGSQAALPKKTPKAAKPVRRGYAYVAQRADGALLLERRPNHGLLSGMLGWPGSEWGDNPNPAPPLTADWQKMGHDVRHTFTHFHLILEVYFAHVPNDATPDVGKFTEVKDFHFNDLPTVMRKVLALVNDQLSHIS